MRKADRATAHGIMLLLFALAISGTTEKARAESESMAELREHAEQGDIEAQSDLGLMYVEGRDVPQDYQQALYWFRRAAEQGVGVAQYNLGVMHEYAHGVPQDHEEAVRWYRRAAEQGMAQAQRALGVMYENERGVPRDYGEAVRWYSRAAEQGDADAKVNLGMAYLNGHGVSRDYVAANRWFRRAAEQGDAGAQVNLGVLYATGQGVPQDYGAARRWWSRAAERQHAEAQYYLGISSANGDGVPQDMEEALRWYGLAAAQGHAGASYNLGVMHAEGQDVPQDYSEAIRYLQQAAESGHASAQYRLGAMYTVGHGAPQDDEEAAHWYRRAAEQGHVGAQFQIASMYAEGHGVPQDDEKAAHWHRQAMEQLLGPGPHVIPPWGASRHLRNLTKGGESQYVIEDDIPHLFKQTRATKKDPRKWLFVVGVEDYRTVADLSHSRHSAQWFARVAAKVLGVTGGRRIVLLDEDATGEAIKGRLARMLAKLKAGDQVYFYYSGHGIAVAEQGNAPYILPQDMTPQDAALDEAFRVENIYRKLTDSGAGQIIAFMDTCFTFDPNAGDESDDGEARARLVPAQPNVPEDGKLAVLMACRENQPSGDYAEEGHRMFSLFVIRELFKDHERIGDLADEVSADITAVTMDLDDGKLRQDPTLQGNRLLEL